MTSRPSSSRPSGSSANSPLRSARLLQQHRPLPLVAHLMNIRDQRRRCVEQPSRGRRSDRANPPLPSPPRETRAFDRRRPRPPRAPHQRRCRAPRLAGGAVAAQQVKASQAGHPPPRSSRPAEGFAAPDGAVVPQARPVPGEDQPLRDQGILSREGRGMGDMVADHVTGRPVPRAHLLLAYPGWRSHSIRAAPT